MATSASMHFYTGEAPSQAAYRAFVQANQSRDGHDRALHNRTMCYMLASCRMAHGAKACANQCGIPELCGMVQRLGEDCLDVAPAPESDFEAEAELVMLYARPAPTPAPLRAWKI